MKCKNCGAELEKGDAFCTNCGNAVKQKNTKAIIIAIVICAVLLIAAAVTVLLIKGPDWFGKDNETTTSSQKEDADDDDKSDDEEDSEEPDTTALVITEIESVPVEEITTEPTTEFTTEATTVSETTTEKKTVPNFTYDEPDQYLFDSANQYITNEYLAGCTRDEITVILNEIYARHGYIFKDTELRAYFNNQSWYSGTVSTLEEAAANFNSIEKANVDAIYLYQKSMGWRS